MSDDTSQPDSTSVGNNHNVSSAAANADPPDDSELSSPQRAMMLTALIIAGESVFFLPFLLPRTFRPTMLELFDLTNQELGMAQGAYGLVATAAYALGGPLADAFRPRNQIAIALVAASLGGILLWQIPSLATLNALYVYWGFTISAFFWAALMKSTREVGGELSPGAAFGILDGGRGLLAVLLSTLLVFVYEALLPGDVETATFEQRIAAFKWVIAIATAGTLLACVPILVLLKTSATEPQRGSLDSEKARLPWSTWYAIGKIVSMPTVWLQALIIICAYSAFKSTDDFSKYANDVFGANEVAAAKLQNFSLWIRPIAAVLFGLLADRLRVSHLVFVCFALVLLGSIGLSGNFWGAETYTMFVVNLASVSIGAYALRGLYFAIMIEAKVPLLYTGTAVGFASVVGYTPEFFMAPLIGYLTDNYSNGHQLAFAVVIGFATLGLTASALFRYVVWRQDQPSDEKLAPPND